MSERETALRAEQQRLEVAARELASRDVALNAEIIRLERIQDDPSTPIAQARDLIPDIRALREEARRVESQLASTTNRIAQIEVSFRDNTPPPPSNFEEPTSTGVTGGNVTQPPPQGGAAGAVDGAIPFPSAPGQTASADDPNVFLPPSEQLALEQAGLTAQEETQGAVDGAIPFPSAPGQIATGEDPTVFLPPSEQLALEQAAAEEERLRNLPPSERLALEQAEREQEEGLSVVETLTARKEASNIDWRVKLSLAPQSNYLYNAPNPGILLPLKATNGVIFPYTPQIDTIYYANYTNEDLVHSNYRGYFYQNSYPGEILMQATFTAQTLQEADYLLAVIHFFRSATKMFYGQDEQRGTPPPLLYLSGFGEYQFSDHPCVISQFNYNLPNDVDYIRASAPSSFNPPAPIEVTEEGNFWQKTAASLLEQFDGTAARLAASALSPGAPANSLRAESDEVSEFVSQGRIASTIQSPTYVPTEISFSLTLYPIQSRKKVSQEFSLKDFASGKLLKRGFW